MLFVYKTSETYPSSQPSFFANTKLNTCNTESLRGEDIKAKLKSSLWYLEVEALNLHSKVDILGIMRCNASGSEFKVKYPTIRDLILSMESLNKLKSGF